MPQRPLHLRTVLGLLVIASSLGGAPKPVREVACRQDREERLKRRCVFYFDGVGGGTMESNYPAGVVEGMIEAGCTGAGELVSWETGKGLMADQKASVAYKRTQAKAAAEDIQSYQAKYPDAPVGLLGLSAGTAEAIFALEVLPEMTQVDHVVMSGTSISCDYDLTEAPKRVKNNLYIFISAHDRMLSLAMPLSGTADRKFHDHGAGIKGFVLAAGASNATRQLDAEKLVTIPYTKDFRTDKNKGHRFDNVKKEFIGDQVAQWFMGQTPSSP